MSYVVNRDGSPARSGRRSAGRAANNGRLLHALSSTALFGACLAIPSEARAQVAPPPNLVSACSGVSLPRSVVTDIMTPVIGGVVAPVENTVNSVLGGLGVLLPLIPSLSIDATGLLNNAASGAPISLHVLNLNGTIVGPGDRCDTQSDSLSLVTPAGISIGGNRITGLGANGLEASAGALDAIAFGNSATTATGVGGAIAIGANAGVGAGATGSVALGSGAQANAGNSVAIGAGSVAVRGALSNYAALGLVGPQNSSGEVSVGAVGAPRQITNVAAGSAPTDAVNMGQLAGVAAQINALGGNAVQYDGLDRDVVTFAGADGTRVTNVAPGTISATSSDAINGAQLHATNTNVANNTTAIANLTTTVAGNSTSIANLTTTINNLGNAQNGGTTAINNLTVTVNELGDTVSEHGTQISNLTTVVNELGDTVTDHSTQISNLTATVNDLGDTVAGHTTVITNLTEVVADNSTAIANLSTNVTNTSNAVTDLTQSIENGAIGPVQYSNAATPTEPNGGTPTNHLALVGAASGPVGLHNVADGAISAGSTDAVNGGQLFAISQVAANALTYDLDFAGDRTNTVTLAGGNAAAPVAINNVAAAMLAANSTGAVNGGQLFATNQMVAGAQATANNALALGQNSVQYDPGMTGVTLNPGGDALALHNVAPGVVGTDAVNLAQLNAGLGSALTQANAYTDSRIDALNFDLGRLRRDAFAGTAGALAAAGLPQAYEAGLGMIAVGGGTYQGSSAIAFGFSKAFNDGHTVAKLGGTYDSRGRAGASGGIGYQF